MEAQVTTPVADVAPGGLAIHFAVQPFPARAAMKPWLAILALCVHLLAAESTRAEPLLGITLVPPGLEVMMGYTGWNIYLDGVIDAASPKRLEEELDRQHVKAGDVFLNSPGGNLQAGIELGRIIRKRGFNTHVSKRGDSKKVAAGFCYSACALAFLSDYLPALYADAFLGVHL